MLPPVTIESRPATEQQSLEPMVEDYQSNTLQSIHGGCPGSQTSDPQELEQGLSRELLLQTSENSAHSG